MTERPDTRNEATNGSKAAKNRNDAHACGCSRPARTGYTLCDHCRTELEQHLSEIPWLLNELDTSLTRTKGIDYRTLGGAHGTETPLPMNTKASTLRDALKAELVAWVRILRLTDETWPTDRIVAIAAWLMARLERIAKHDAGYDIAQGVARAFLAGKTAVDTARRERTYIAPCEGQINDEGEITETECVGEIWVIEGAVIAECDQCLRAYDVRAALNRRDELLADKLMTAQEIANLAHRTFGQPVRKVYNLVTTWNRRKIIRPSGTDQEGASRFPYGDVIVMLARTYGES